MSERKLKPQSFKNLSLPELVSLRPIGQLTDVKGCTRDRTILDPLIFLQKVSRQRSFKMLGGGLMWTVMVSVLEASRRERRPAKPNPGGGMTKRPWISPTGLSGCGGSCPKGKQARRRDPIRIWRRSAGESGATMITKSFSSKLIPKPIEQSCLKSVISWTAPKAFAAYLLRRCLVVERTLATRRQVEQSPSFRWSEKLRGAFGKEQQGPIHRLNALGAFLM